MLNIEPASITMPRHPYLTISLEKNEVPARRVAAMAGSAFSTATNIVMQIARTTFTIAVPNDSGLEGIRTAESTTVPVRWGTEDKQGCAVAGRTRRAQCCGGMATPSVRCGTVKPAQAPATIKQVIDERMKLRRSGERRDCRLARARPFVFLLSEITVRDNCL